MAGAGSAGQRLDNFLLRELAGLPRSRVYRLLRKGEVRVNDKVLSSVVAPVRDGGGKLEGVVVVLRDFTEAKALARRPLGALKATKALMRDGGEITRVMEAEIAVFVERLRTREAAEAFQAFAERRPPDFVKLEEKP